MVGVAQLVEPWIVIPVVVGSNPIVHPIFGPLAQLVEQVTLNHLVEGSSPSRPTINKIIIEEIPAVSACYRCLPYFSGLSRVTRQPKKNASSMRRL